MKQITSPFEALKVSMTSRISGNLPQLADAKTASKALDGAKSRDPNPGRIFLETDEALEIDA